MTAENRHRALRRVLGTGDHRNAHLSEFLERLVVVDQLAQHHAGAALRLGPAGGLQRCGHRSAHARAVPGVTGNFVSHPVSSASGSVVTLKYSPPL